MKFDFKKEKEQMPMEDEKVEVSQENQTHKTKHKASTLTLEKTEVLSTHSTHYSIFNTSDISPGSSERHFYCHI